MTEGFVLKQIVIETVIVPSGTTCRVTTEHEIDGVKAVRRFDCTAAHWMDATIGAQRQANEYLTGVRRASAKVQARRARTAAKTA